MGARIKSSKHQRGVGLFGFMFYFAIFAGGTLLGLKIFPLYLEHYAVKKVIAAMAASDEAKTGTVAEIRASFERRAAIDSIKSITGDDLDISKEGGTTVIAVAWQQKVQLFKSVSLVLDFAASTAEP